MESCKYPCTPSVPPCPPRPLWQPVSQVKTMRIVAISDTHGHHRELDIPPGDVLVHAGDLTRFGERSELRDFNNFVGSLPHKHKVIVAGNHDFCFERDRESCAAELKNCIYLQDDEVTLDGVSFYGSPWQPWFYDWAFNLRRGPEIRAKWDLIPSQVDILITHGPPAGVLDRTLQGAAVGCIDLLEVVERVKPRLHIFGHIHEGAGIIESDGTTFINASTCNIDYRAVNPPIVFDLTATS